MRTKLLAILVANLFAGGSALAADEPFIWNGSGTLGGRLTDTEGAERNGAYGTSGTTLAPFTGPRDEAKANEYRDLDNNVISVIDARGGNSKYFFRFFGENFGADDQYFDLRGGAYGLFKAQLYQDKIPHYLSWNALTPLSNPGGTKQTGAGAYPPYQNPATWNSFDYGIQRDTTGGNFEVSLNSPWFVRADYNQVETTGVKVNSGQLGTGSSNGIIELGMPVDTMTKNATIEAGYTGKTWNIKLAFLDSKFDSGVGQVAWSNFYMQNALDVFYSPPESELKKWSLSGSVRSLPFDSALVARVTQSKLTNSFAVDGYGLKPAGSHSPPTGVGYLYTAPSSSNFDGDHKTTSAAVSLTSTPVAKLESRLYYSYYDKENNSTAIGYAAGGQGPAGSTCPGGNTVSRYCLGALAPIEPFGYEKTEYGLDLAYRFTPRHKLSGGVGVLLVDRHLEPAPETEDRSFWLEYRGRLLDNFGGRLTYRYTERRSEFDHSYTNNSSGQTPAQVPYYFAAYDVSNSDRDKVKLQFDWTPLPELAVNFGATWQQTDYKDLYYGRLDDTRTTYDLTVTYGDPSAFHVTAIGNWGDVEFNQAYRTIASGQSPLPGGPQTATTFDWGTANTQGNWLVGLQADWPVNERLAVMGSVSYGETDGGVDFWSGSYAGAGGFQGGPLVNYVTDNTETTRINLKADYRFNKSWSMTAGYAYEKYDYADDQMRGYQGYYPYYQNLGSTNNSWYSGAYANPGYTNNIFYLTAKWTWDPPITPPPAMKVAQAPVSAPAPAVTPPPPKPAAPAAAPAPAPQVQKITLDSKVLFDFDKAVLKPEGKAAIDSQVVGKLAQVQKLEVVLVTGHTDRLGSDAYNQKLSVKRADAVRDYLVGKGVDKARIETLGLGEKQPVVQCEQKNRKELIACLAPNRRVEVQVKGEATRR